jgi:hypothetical protein
MIMVYECNCGDVSLSECKRLMKGARKCSYKKLVARIKKEYPKFYYGLGLDFYNPWESECKQTRTHYILVHSAIEYFFRK